mmetsp:Transcript_108834/g.289449  ORF Transcript_108834/g.289449 Transcript_108834/m.289449 type:complete len:141 (-) Transcript_108834:192-614(-)
MMDRYSGGAVLAFAMALALCWRRRRRSRCGVSAAQFEPMRVGELPPSPYPLLRRWLADAEGLLGSVEARFVVVATCSQVEGATARTVLLQSVDDKEGLVFGSNSDSLKARTIAEDSRVEAVFRWGQRQVFQWARAWDWVC